MKLFISPILSQQPIARDRLMQQEQKTLKNENNHLTDNAEEHEFLSPGHMLKEARESKGLSQQDVAEKLNFRVSLVQDIEKNHFNLSLPEAFNRGYLKNYAKLVNVGQESVLACYEKLEVAQGKCSGMQSFSKGTEKQAEHNMLMWLTYLILAILVTATVVWWLQTPSEQPEPIISDADQSTVVIDAKTEVAAALSDPEQQIQANSQLNITSNNLVTEPLKGVTDDSSLGAQVQTQALTGDVSSDVAAVLSSNTITNKQEANIQEAQKISEPLTPKDNQNSKVTALSKANLVFTFSGDCWVNIFDATGERVAWGVKKSGYIMKVSGQPPFSITLGKPELVQIDYNDVSVDMSEFNAGNIAKFSLPLAP